jgi:2-C-methyl-D-erythritol 4-phosphate cytidylyltransferase
MNNRPANHTIWAVVPAAGVGKRMQSAIPKQYLPLNGRPVLEHTLNQLLANESIDGLVIALQQDDGYWADISFETHKPVIRAPGGKERADSVLSALDALLQQQGFDEDASETLWVMVHDAVRPCVRQEDIDKLVSEIGDDANGGLLALPVRDTMKRQKTDSDSHVSETVDRENLWHALTPQYFQAKALKAALESGLEQGLAITDESSAMEFAGFSPRLVSGHEDNIKITRPADLQLASLYLSARDDK